MAFDNHEEAGDPSLWQSLHALTWVAVVIILTLISTFYLAPLSRSLMSRLLQEPALKKNGPSAPEVFNMKRD